MKKGGSIYLLTNKNNTVIYTGVTEDLIRRVQEHKSKFDPNSFTAKYNLDKLVYFEGFHTIDEAIAREKQIKAGSRAKKEKLINSVNPTWKDLYNELLSE
ncbi:GIY-YIG nuclease family protein [Algoriphagus chordae]|uniref:Putative endonuclease n=1 Tax=Algoriphagus chordae TaxID=237019 RepID=A0A2W7QGV9_9BACT|nr:GIY-YIG nuclease family protein [Algoriphagus chordae]PZX47768.1 putative endonuclease [Algoriphagus chordae]